MTVEEIPLKNLRENNYNPRTRFDDAAMADLKESIEDLGLNQSLRVRPVDENGTYEVIAGIRRLKALRDLYGDDHPVECIVSDVDDDGAQWIALAENLNREDLTPVEEAWAFAEYVTVDYRGEEGSYAEYIKGVKENQVSIEVPSNRHPNVEALAERIAPTHGIIANRLRLLALPEPVLSQIEAGDLGTGIARRIADKLRTVPDPEYRQQQMARIAEQAIAEPLGAEDVEAKAESARDEWEDRQQQDLERVEGFSDAATSAESDLRSELVATVEWYNDREDTDGDLSTNGERTLLDAANSATSALQERIAELGGGRLTELDDEESDLKQERNRLEQNVEIVRAEGHDRCPFCKAGILIPDIEDRIEEYEHEIEAVQEQKSELNDDREAYREQRSELREAITEFEDAVSRLRSQLDSKDIDADDLDATVPDAALREGGA